MGEDPGHEPGQTDGAGRARAGARAGDASSSAEGRSKDGLVRMQGKILKSLAHAHLRAKNFSAAQSVLAFLSQIVGETQIRRHGSYQYMAIEALLGLGKCEEALAMLKSTTSTSPPPPELHGASVKQISKLCKLIYI